MALEVFQLVFSDLLEMKNALPPFLCKKYECTAGAEQWKQTKASTSFQLFRTIDQDVYGQTVFNQMMAYNNMRLSLFLLFCCWN